MSSNGESNGKDGSLAQGKGEAPIRPDEPTATAIGQAVSNILGMSAAPSCHRISEGTHHAVYAVGESHIARCLPKSTRSQTSLHRDAAVQRLAQTSMNTPVRIPEVVETFHVDGWSCNLETRVVGTSLGRSHATSATEDDLAKLLMALRRVPVGEATIATGYQQEEVNLKARVGKAIRAWNEIVQHGHAVDAEGRMARLLRQRLEVVSGLPRDPYAPVFLHGDINDENVLVDESDGSVVGLVDWSDAIVGDACIDMSGVVFAVGQRMARRVWRKAGLSKFAMERSHLYAMTVVIRDLQECLEDGEAGDDVQHLEGLLRCEFGRAFEGMAVALLSRCSI